MQVFIYWGLKWKNSKIKNVPIACISLLYPSDLNFYLKQTEIDVG